MSTKRFRIAFSFAGEKRVRDFVEACADLLAAKFSKENILYDKYHEAEFAVFNLGIKLPKLYGEQSELIVPVLCPNYDAKRWTGWEWMHIYGLLTKEDGHRVMPSRFEYATADGLSPTSGFIELDDTVELNDGDSVTIPHDFQIVPSVIVVKEVGGVWLDATGSYDLEHAADFASTTITNTSGVTLTFRISVG